MIDIGYHAVQVFKTVTLIKTLIGADDVEMIGIVLIVFIQLCDQANGDLASIQELVKNGHAQLKEAQQAFKQGQN